MTFRRTSDVSDSPNSARPKLFDLVKLAPLMERTSGRSEIAIGLIDGPVDTRHSDLASESINLIPSSRDDTGVRAGGAVRTHGTFIAGILCAKRTSPAPAICPGCTLLVRPIF